MIFASVVFSSLYSFSKRQILDSSKLNKFADDNFKFDEISVQLSKGRKHCTRNFSFSRSVFKRLVLQTCKNQGLFGKGLNHYLSQIKEQLTLYVSHAL